MGLTKAAIEALISAVGASANYNNQRTIVGPASTQTILPGPPAGFVRVIPPIPTVILDLDANGGTDEVQFRFVSTLGTHIFQSSLYPGGFYGGQGAFGPQVLFSGEYLELQHVFGPNNVIARVNYLDVPDTGIIPIRLLTNGTSPVVLMPQPSPGKAHLLSGGVPGLGSSGGYLFFHNRDTVYHGLSLSQGGFRDWKNENPDYPPGQVQPHITIVQALGSDDAALLVALNEPTVTNEFAFLGWYKEYDAAP